MTLSDKLYLAGAVLTFVFLCLPYSWLPARARLYEAPPLVVLLRALLLAALWPFVLPVFAAMLASPKLYDWVHKGHDR